MLRTPDTLADQVRVRALDQSRGMEAQRSRVTVDVSKLLATRTAPIRGGLGKRPTFPSGDKRGDA
jgi:hypothetical protein